ncbi:MAG: OmpA family protein [Myxococcales bacterium]|nr:OmpA family protein [Myxococcales bacterium]
MILLVGTPAEAVCLGGAPDGRVGPTEGCDDNNNTNGDGCSAMCDIETEFSCARMVSFNNLNIQNFPGSTAAWTVGGAGTTGLQTVNTARPTVALFGEDAYKGTYAVRMQVEEVADDDVIGLVLGFDPGDPTSANASYLVVDWKQGLQEGIPPGLRVAHVRGVPFDPAGGANTTWTSGIPARRCDNATTSCVTQLALGRTLGTTGWADNTPYTAYVTYRPDRLEVLVGGRLELLLRPTDFPGQFPGNVFPAGQMGFFLLSQEQVRYTNLAPNGASACNLTALASTIINTALGTPSVTVNTASLLTDVGDALAPASVAVINTPAGGTATVAPSGAITFTPTNPNVPGTYLLDIYACDNDAVIPDCDTATITIHYSPDRDGDGVLDSVDIDDDDDGIPDRQENTLNLVPDADADGDGVPNFRDRNNRGDGMANVCPDTNNDNICDSLPQAYDRDGDGVANHLDLDADGDGILDVIEAYPNLPDATRNGRLDCPGGVGSNGLCNAFETVADNGVVDWNDDNTGPDQALNTDADGLPDFLDVDADGDGLYDLHEGNSGCTDTAPADGRCDGPDSDGDGVVNSRDAQNGHGVSTYPDRPDTDGDGTPDYRDLDADGDTIPDLVEGDSGCVDAMAPAGVCDGADGNGDGRADDAAATRPDTDSDGFPDYRDVDADGDGLRDNVEGRVDTDGDGRPDFRDLDSDNDGIADVIEGSSGCADAAPRNGRCDGADSNGDGLADGATNQTPPDTDGDGAVDFRDLDTDNDGIPDRVEGGSGCTDTTPANAVCDGPDANGDGLADNATLVPAPNADGDSAPDFRDLDSDDDGLVDVIEGGSGCTDANGNSVCDGPDTDHDGIADSIDDTNTFGDPTPTTPRNTDGADVPDYLDPDSNNDGTPDSVGSGCTDTVAPAGRCDGPDTDGDGVVDGEDDFPGFGTRPDRDGDGVVDNVDLDDDNDGIPDATERGKDTDGDGVTDDLDLDSDNDGLPDVAEAGHGQPDANGDGLIDCAGGFGANGLCNAVETTPDSGMARTPPVDTDGDGIPDFRDLDSDDDGLSDRQENGTRCADVPANGVCDGGDPDRDGSPSSADSSGGFGVGGYPVPPDTDNDGTPDYRDLDSDGDSIPDVVENGDGPADSNDDGRVDGPDRDGDGMRDVVDDSDGDGTPDAQDPGPPVFGGANPTTDTDGDGTPDARDQDSDNDGLEDEIEVGDDPHNPVDGDQDGKPDFQDPDSDNDMIGDNVDNCRTDTNPDQGDQGNDGLGDVCDSDDNDDGFDDGLGVSGGGCSTSGGAGGAGLGLMLVAAAVAMGRRRRRTAATTALAAGAAGAMLASAGQAQAQVSSQYSAERFQLTGHRDGILGVEWAEVNGHLTVDLGLWLGYANDPVNVYRMSDGDRVGSLVANRLGGDLVAAVRFKNRFELGVAAPLIVAQSNDLGSLMGAAPSGDLSGFGLGDLRLTPKVTLVRQSGRSPVSLALMLGVTLPTSTSDDYGGDDGVTASPALLVSRGRAVGIRLAAAMGYRARPKAQALNLVVDDEVFGQLGAAYRWSNSFEVDGTFDVATGADDVLGAFNRNHAEARLGAGYDVTRNLRAFGAAGAGVAEGFGTPDWRLLLGVRVATGGAPKEAPVLPPRVVDSDGDGLLDPDDRCVAEPETKNGFQDDDGCPDVDDPDGDKVIGAADGCPDTAEDIDAFEDGNGCPEPDNDQDGILDTEDACREVPGVAAMRGCPDPDRDGDTVVDRLDNCPDEPGEVDNQGCKAKQRVKISEGKIEILDIVYFALNRAEIQKRSNSLLDEVARVLNAHPEISKIRVEGHTDNQGNDAYNKSLSQRRADAVRVYLVKQGVDAARLEAMGYGEEQPKADNTTKEGRASNRRVEFTILGADGVEVRPTGPTQETMEK